MAKESPPWMGLLAAELGCCCRVFVSCKASSLRAEMVYEDLMLPGQVVSVNKPEVERGARRSI